MEPLNDFARCARRDQEALPTNHIEARHGLGKGRHFGQDRRALQTRNRKRANLARFYLGQGRRDGVELELNLTPDKIGHRLRRAFIRHVHEFDAGQVHE